VPARQATQHGGIGSLESILGVLKSLKIRALVGFARLICLIDRIFFILFTVAAHLINVMARMLTNGLEKIKQIKLDSNDEKVYHARRTQGCGGFKLHCKKNWSEF
jgi:hypothetical protein